MTIHRLSDETISQISAGEVVERPAAVVKELLENAIDAQATRIDVILEDGGTSLLEVRDDGDGIPFADLKLAVERNATSKLQRIDDLDKLATLGFRGEALASIGSVAMLTITSATTASASGGQIRVKFGEVHSSEHRAWGGGTAVTVQRLFENVPARRKFLRKPRTETTYARRIAAAYALAYPQIAISFTSDGKTDFATHGSGDPLETSVHVWGASVAEHLVELGGYEHEHHGYEVSGIVSLPSIDRANRLSQFLFVGGRLIVNRQLTTAFEQAYHTQLMIGRRPLGCISIAVPPDKVDINVHPTKREVRFAEDRLVFAIVQRTVRATLLNNASYQPVPSVLASPIIGSQPDPAVQRRLKLAHPDGRVPSQAAAGILTDVGYPASTAAEGNEIQPTSTSGIPMLRVLGQVAGMFVIAEGPDGLYLIDQHAAHERILYERLKREYDDRSLDSQALLEPVIVELTPAQESMFEQSMADLNGIGFDVVEFGAESVAIRAVPAILKVRDPGRSLLTILDELIEGGRGESRLESLAISAACHGSIRAGQPLSLLEMRELVEQLEACSSPLACGHGRPTVIKMTADELARQFARR